MRIVPYRNLLSAFSPTTLQQIPFKFVDQVNPDFDLVSPFHAGLKLPPNCCHTR